MFLHVLFHKQLRGLGQNDTLTCLIILSNQLAPSEQKTPLVEV